MSNEGVDALEILAEGLEDAELLGFMAGQGLNLLRQAAGGSDVIALRFEEDGKVTLMKTERVGVIRHEDGRLGGDVGQPSKDEL